MHLPCSAGCGQVWRKSAPLSPTKSTPRHKYYTYHVTPACCMAASPSPHAKLKMTLQHRILSPFDIEFYIVHVLSKFTPPFSSSYPTCSVIPSSSTLCRFHSSNSLFLLSLSHLYLAQPPRHNPLVPRPPIHHQVGTSPVPIWHRRINLVPIRPPHVSASPSMY